MNFLFIYILIGLLIYPASMDMWYRVCYKRNEFYNPNNIGSNWYLGFILMVIFWIVAFPLQSISYIKELKK